jgi:tetratricopeptide (TPR) repeat protein
MQRNLKNGLFVVAVAAAMVASAGCDKLKARDKLNKGVQAYKDAQFDLAVEDFKEAKALDPKLMNARVYLATAYASQYIPGAPSQDNLNYANQAIAEFKDVLSVEPNNLSAIDGIGSLLWGMGSNPYNEQTLEDAKQYHLKHITVDPADPASYYWVEVIDWAIAYHADRLIREDYNNKNVRKPLKDSDPLPDKLATQYAQKYGSLVDEGIKYANDAMDRKPEYDDAMAYLNLLYRSKADMETSKDARDADLKQADDLVHKVQIIKQQRMANPQAVPTS